jgi:hypothetical protein
MKKVSLFLFLIPIAIAGTYAGGIPEPAIHIDPETLVPLPPELIGEFEFSYNDDERHTFLVIEIYENNGFLFKWIGQKPNGWKDGIGKDYGQVIQEDGDYYFMAMGAV